jgi:hypothetical protein
MFLVKQRMIYKCKSLVSGLLVLLLFGGSGCRAMHPVQERPSDQANVAETRTDLPGAITGDAWHIHWRTRDPAKPHKMLRVLDADARSGELADKDDTQTLLLHDVVAHLYRAGRHAADIQAPQVTANERDRLLVGTGGVTLHSLSDPPNTVVTADTITWDMRTGAIRGVGNTHVVQHLSDGTTNEQQGGHVTYNDRTDTFDVTAE